jgi:endonuclease/exonuclease/phosphatase family metal-dependent hydrolase
MLKLISLNIETNKHYDLVVPFLTTEMADVVCLQESPREMLDILARIGYNAAFLPMFKKNLADTVHDIGVILAARTPFLSRAHYYYQPTKNVVLYDEAANEKTESLGYLIADINIEGSNFCIATTHFWDSGNGHEDTMQIRLMKKLLAALQNEPSHIICGDFNVPREHNELYPELCQVYSDNIPHQYKSSLDRNLHRLGHAALNEPIFDSFMVDHLLTKSPYRATDVRLQFGVSDHAAIVATLLRD